MVRFLRASLLSLALVGTLLSPAIASTTFQLDGHFKESFGRPASADPCDLVPPFCGEGTVRGLGTATTLFYDGGLKTITLDSDGSTLVMQETLVSVTTPGNSTNAPGSEVSFGNPYTVVVTWVAIPGDSTGFFAGATGSGTTTVVTGGDAIVVTTTGTLTLL